MLRHEVVTPLLISTEQPFFLWGKFLYGGRVDLIFYFRLAEKRKKTAAPSEWLGEVIWYVGLVKVDKSLKTAAIEFKVLSYLVAS